MCNKSSNDIFTGKEMLEFIAEKAAAHGGSLNYQIGFLASALAHANQELRVVNKKHSSPSPRVWNFTSTDG